MSYCTSADITKIYPNVAAFDLKRTLDEYQFVQHSGAVYKLYDSGAVGRLFRDGEDLGAAQSALVDVDTAGDWFLESASDILYTQIPAAGTVSNYRWESSPDTFSNLIEESISRGAELLESELDDRFPRPIPKTNRSDDSREYDWPIIKLNSLLAVLDLGEASNPNHPDLAAIRNQIYGYDDQGNPIGLLRRLNAGEVKLSFEITRSDSGEVWGGAQDAATTGYITDVRGNPATDYDQIKIMIDTGGTLATGDENTVIKYSTYDRNGDKIVDNQLVTGYHQTLGAGMTGRFADGVYTVNDYWYLEVTGLKSTTSRIGAAELVRK